MCLLVDYTLPISNSYLLAIDLSSKPLSDFLYIIKLYYKECYNLPYYRVGLIERVIILAGYVVDLDNKYG